MKRAEAIEWLEVMKENAIFEQCDALKMAIEALQTTETSTDLVSRADVVKEFIKLFGCIQDVSDIDDWADICQTTIREVPSTKISNNTQTIDLISRVDALKPFCVAPDGTRIPEVDCDNFPVEFNVEFIKKHLLSLPSANRPKEVRKSHGDLVDIEDIEKVLADLEEYEEITMQDIRHELWKLPTIIEARENETLKESDDIELTQSKKCEDCIHDDINKDKITCKECVLTKAKGDLISRADAIEAVVCHIWHTPPEARKLFNCENYVRDVVEEAFKSLPSIDVVSREEYDKLYDDAISELTKLEKEYDDVIAQLNQKLENSVSRKAYEKALIECEEVKTKLGELQQTTKANQGEWIKTVDGNGWNDWYVFKCPFCGATIEDKQSRSWEYNFCPNCRADLRSEKHE